MSKYNSRKVERDGMVFDSAKEARRNGCTLSYGKWQAERWMKEQKEK